MSHLKSEVRYRYPFPNAKATNKGEYADFANFDPKLVAMATSLVKLSFFTLLVVPRSYRCQQSGEAKTKIINIIIINLLWRHSTGDQQRLAYIETYGKK